MRLYGELAPWFHLLTRPEDYAEEAKRYRSLILEASPDASTLLELGAGGGNNASHLKQDFDCTLSDVSPQMLAVSKELNPDCDHVLGDMRTMRLGRTFDAVFAHDALAYLTTAEELADAIGTAYAHTRPGGIALFVPDFTRETFTGDSVETGGHDGGDGRSLRFLQWTHDPDPEDTTYEVEYAVLMREPGKDVRAVHDHHHEGVFPEHVWLTLLEQAGFRVTVDRSDDPETPQQAFVASRPA
jgi:SAM-dependent methyltransferase